MVTIASGPSFISTIPSLPWPRISSPASSDTAACEVSRSKPGPWAPSLAASARSSIPRASIAIADREPAALLEARDHAGDGGGALIGDLAIRRDQADDAGDQQRERRRHDPDPGAAHAACRGDAGARERLLDRVMR